MKLTFLGTRGEIEIRSRSHRRHSALLIEHGDARIMIDCGTDWLHRLGGIAPTAVVLTHAHDDHAAGLVRGAPCPVYATAATWKRLCRFPILDRRTMPLRKPVRIDGMRFTAFPVMHSLRAPAVGYRVSSQQRGFFYLPDVAKLPNPARALHRVDVYIGDGATIKRSMVRKKGSVLVGHAPVIHQLAWCAKAHVRRAIFTHCGSQIVRTRTRAIDFLVGRVGREHDINARIARDGDRLSLRPATGRNQSSGD